MSATPRVSVIVPVFNEPPEVLRASLASLRNQSWQDFDCVVVDESTDVSRARECEAQCALDSRFRYVHPASRLGLPGSLNLAIDQSSGDYIARFDSDDVCLPERLARQIAFLDAHPEIAIVGGALEVIDDDDRTTALRTYPTDHEAIERGMQTTNTMAHPTVMYRRTATAVHGAYDASFRYSEDLDLWLRWLNAGMRFANLPDVVVRYRQKSTSRQTLHWKYNLRARLHNFSSRHIARRCAGIAAIGIWMILPQRVQESVFRLLMFRAARPAQRRTQG
jgi:glycosyltransferase involved in cell wall biosynthesis